MRSEFDAEAAVAWGETKAISDNARSAAQVRIKRLQKQPFEQEWALRAAILICEAVYLATPLA